jgi:hypothetical protein
MALFSDGLYSVGCAHWLRVDNCPCNIRNFAFEVNFTSLAASII